VRARIALFLAIAQSILLLAHAFLYETWIAFWGAPERSEKALLQVVFILLAVSFIAASLLARRFSNAPARLLYTISAVWLGVLSFCVVAACLCWAVYAGEELFGLRFARRPVAAILFALAILASFYGILNAARLRVRRIALQVANLPEAWHGRVAALLSDTHLGPVRRRRFLERIVATLARCRPDAVFIAGDLYDGAAADLDWLAEPLAKLPAPLGAYFVAGNHEEFSDRRKCLAAVERSGVRVLNNEKVVVDGLQIVGVHHGATADAERYRAVLRRAALDRGRASLLLTHAPVRLRVAADAGVSLALCGHTHAGQFFPFTCISARIFGAYVYGLNRFGKLTVYTSSGAGTWGPPMRVGTSPEIVLIRFEGANRSER
jgi:uncharacterized protein